MESFCFSHIEDDLHDNFVTSRLDGTSSVYVEDPSSKTPLHLNAYCNVSSREAQLPIILAGPEGIGKSAAIANWTRQRKDNVISSRGLGYQEFVFYHAIGCSRLSTSVLHLLRRLITSLINHFELKEAIDLADEKLPWVLPRLLERASKKGKVVIVIDGGLQHICSHDENYGLKWLPLQLPSNVRMIISVTTPCENPPQISDYDAPNICYATRLQNKIKRVWDELQRRKWPMICLKEFDPNQAAAIVEKNLPPESSNVAIPRKILVKSILSHEYSTNALFLTTLLKGVRHAKECLRFKQKEVEQCLNLWTSSSIKTCNDLIESMLTVFECGPNNIQELPSQPRHTLDSNESSRLGTLLSHSLSLLFVSRHGLREDELLELVEHVRENARWEKQTKDTVIPIKLKILQCIMTKKNRLIDIFRSFDEDGNGTLSREEFYKGMERLNLKGVTQHDVTLLINEVDNNADGEIDYVEILDHFEGISRKFSHGGRRRSVFGSVGPTATSNDKESLNDDFCRNLIATLQCVGVTFINSAEADKILTIPFENTTLRDVIWKKYLRSAEGESSSRNFLIEYFNKKEPCLRICEELPWHLKKSNDLVALKKLLNDLRVLDIMYNTDELKPELFVYLLRLSQGKKFDIVYEYNRSVERWKGRNNPTASQLCGMIGFLAEVMSWYNKNISSQITTPDFMRKRITDNQLHKLEIDVEKDILPNASTVEPSDYFLLRWIWIQCPWLALKGTAKAISMTQKVHSNTKETDAVPEIDRNNISSRTLPDSSRVRAMINTGAKSLPNNDNKFQSEEITDLDSAYVKLNEVRETYNNLVVKASERESLLKKLEHLVHEQETKEKKNHRALAAKEAIVDQLQIRLNQINEMIDGANRVQSVHENILVVLQSCRPSFQTEHLQLEQQIVLSRQQMSDLTRQQNVIDNEIEEIQAHRRELVSRIQNVMAEKENLRPQLDAMKLRAKEELERKKAERNTSFDPSAFNRRMKLEGIIARRRQVQDNSDDKSRFVNDVENLSALHPMEKLAHAAGSFDPDTIVAKLKASEALSRELSLRQEKQELITKQQRNILHDLHQKVENQHLLTEPSSNNDMDDQDLKDAEALLRSRKKSLQRLESLISNVVFASQHLYTLAESIQHLEEEESQFNFAMEKNESSSSSEAKDVVSCIKAIYIPENQQGTLPHKTLLARNSLDNSFNKRVLNKEEIESSYHEATDRLIEFEDDECDGRNEMGRTKHDSEEDLIKLASYVRQSKTNASEIEQRRANTLCRTSQKNNGLILESLLQLEYDSPDSKKIK